MRQQRLGSKRDKTIKSQTRSFDQDNTESARLILANPEKYGGESAGLVIWARMALKRIEGERQARQ